MLLTEFKGFNTSLSNFNILFLLFYLWGIFCSYTSWKTTYYKRLETKADMRIQPSSIKWDIKEICKNVHNAQKFENHCSNIWEGEKQLAYIYTAGAMRNREEIQSEPLPRSNVKAGPLNYSVQDGYKNGVGRIWVYYKEYQA